jgi:hypothetical protein
VEKVTGSASEKVVNNIEKGSNQGSEPIDTERPVITLNGEASTVVTSGAIYTDLGATAKDDRDSDITNRLTATIRNTTGSVIQVVSNVTGTAIEIIDTKEPGNYTVTYEVSDKAGNKAEVTRTVVVLPLVEVDKIKPTITFTGGILTTTTGGVINLFDGITVSDEAGNGVDPVLRNLIVLPAREEDLSGPDSKQN